MIELECWGCGRVGRVPQIHEGRWVHCRRCGTKNLVTAAVTKDDFTAPWIDAAARDTAEFDAFPATIPPG